MDNNKITYSEYLILRSRLEKLSFLLKRMHHSVAGVEILQEYNLLREKLANAHVVDEKRNIR